MPMVLKQIVISSISYMPTINSKTLFEIICHDGHVCTDDSHCLCSNRRNSIAKFTLGLSIVYAVNGVIAGANKNKH